MFVFWLKNVFLDHINLKTNNLTLKPFPRNSVNSSYFLITDNQSYSFLEVSVFYPYRSNES